MGTSRRRTSDGRPRSQRHSVSGGSGPREWPPAELPAPLGPSMLTSLFARAELELARHDLLPAHPDSPDSDPHLRLDRGLGSGCPRFRRRSRFCVAPGRLGHGRQDAGGGAPALPAGQHPVLHDRRAGRPPHELAGHRARAALGHRRDEADRPREHGPRAVHGLRGELG